MPRILVFQHVAAEPLGTLDARIRAKLDLNDEQIKKIQEIREKGGETFWTSAQLTERVFFTRNYSKPSTVDLHDVRFPYAMLVTDASPPSKSELLKVLTPQQIETLEKLGLKIEKGK